MLCFDLLSSLLDVLCHAVLRPFSILTAQGVTRFSVRVALDLGHVCISLCIHGAICS